MDVPPLLLVDKPVGITSFGVVARLRRATGVKKVGHAGTLDPLASGLMLVGLGVGTKLLSGLVKLDKEYVAEILIGQKRSTGDLEGVVLESRSVDNLLSVDVVESALKTLQPRVVLPVSAYSAIKKDGVPMYKRARAAARQGRLVTDVPWREMVVYEAELLALQPLCFEGQSCQLARVRFAVGSGTYIRSLAEALGERVGYPATLYSLRRTMVGDYQVIAAKTLAELMMLYGIEKRPE